MAKISTFKFAGNNGEGKSPFMGADCLVANFNGAGEVTIDFSRIPQEIWNLAAQHGLKQKLGDSYAGAANAYEARESFELVAERLMSGNWNKPTESTGGQSEAKLLEEAVARATGKAIEVVQAKLDEMDKESQKALAKQTQVAAAIQEIKAERAQERAKALQQEATGAGDLDSLFD